MEVALVVIVLGAMLNTYVTTTDANNADVQPLTLAKKWNPHPYGGCPVEKGYVLYHNRCLKLYTIKQDYHTAKSRCEADGAHLFNFKSREQDGPALLLLMDTMDISLPSGEGLWIGADDITTEGHFLWSDGTTLSRDSRLWASGQPDDAGNNEDCVEIVLLFNIGINDANCLKMLGFVCQTDIEMQ